MNKEKLKLLIKKHHANRYEFAKSVCISKSLIDKILSGHCEIKKITSKLFEQHFQVLALEKATKELSTLSLGVLLKILNEFGEDKDVSYQQIIDITEFNQGMSKFMLRNSVYELAAKKYLIESKEDEYNFKVSLEKY